MKKFCTIAVIGKPNVGKSTLMNAILGTHLSIVTNKPQTTRKRVLGIYTDADTQLVFTDTPGLLKPRYKMQHMMMGYVQESLAENDIFCVVIDTVKAIEHGTVLDPAIVSILSKHPDVPAVLVMNKMDAVPVSKMALPLVEEARGSKLFAKAIAVSAKTAREVDSLVTILKELSPEGEFLYDEDALSTLPDRFFVAELIREQIFAYFKEEVPYATDVSITEFRERETGKWFVSADIVVERDTQKGILIGAGGTTLKMIGEKSRATIETHLGHAVFLELYVKVRENWRNDKAQLNGLGY